jgi:hypothetical protein
MSVIFEGALQYLFVAGLAALTKEHLAVMQVYLLARYPLLFEPSQDFFGQEKGAAFFSMRTGRYQ